LLYLRSVCLFFSCLLNARLALVLPPELKLDLIVIAVRLTQQSPPGTTFVPWPCCFSPVPVNRWALLLPPLTLHL
jgi:hypothetical protein